MVETWYCIGRWQKADLRFQRFVFIDGTDETDLANLQLVAAAPELLEALENLIDLNTLMSEGADPERVHQEWIEAVDKAQTVISKAKGL